MNGGDYYVLLTSTKHLKYLNHLINSDIVPANSICKGDFSGQKCTFNSEFFGYFTTEQVSVPPKQLSNSQTVREIFTSTVYSLVVSHFFHELKLGHQRQ